MNTEPVMDWTRDSKSIDGLDVEVCFQLRDTFYVGDPNSHKQLQGKKYREVLELPDFERVVKLMARTSEAIENTESLSSYYKTIINRSVALRKPFNEIRSYFWLRLWFYNTSEEVHISFPWYDSLSEMQQFFSWLKSNPDEVFIDMDQGWQVEALRIGEKLHVRQIDPDYPSEEIVNVSMPFKAFAEKIAEVETRAVNIITKLSNDLGADVWTKYLENASFGTEEWQPNKNINRAKKIGGIFNRLFNR